MMYEWIYILINFYIFIYYMSKILINKKQLMLLEDTNKFTKTVEEQTNSSRCDVIGKEWDGGYYRWD